MCGIFGVAYYGKLIPSKSQAKSMRKVCRELMIASEIKGDDASGICVLTKNEAVVYKNHMPASQIVKRPAFNKALINVKSDPFARAVLGHARSRTKGSEYKNVNNHPIIAGNVIGIHNGTIWNDEMIYSQEKNLKRRGEVDSEVVFRLIDMYASRKDVDLVKAVQLTTSRIAGSYACAFIHLDAPNYLTLFRNSGKGEIYIYEYDQFDTILFASLPSILSNSIKESDWFNRAYISNKFKVQNNSGIRINLENDGRIFCFETEKNNDHLTSQYSYFG